MSADAGPAGKGTSEARSGPRVAETVLATVSRERLGVRRTFGIGLRGGRGTTPGMLADADRETHERFEGEVSGRLFVWTGGGSAKERTSRAMRTTRVAQRARRRLGLGRNQPAGQRTHHQSWTRVARPCAPAASPRREG